MQSTLPHVSTLSCPHQTVYSQCLAKLHTFLILQLLIIQFIKSVCFISSLYQFSDCSCSILIIKPTRCTNFSNLHFWNKTLHVSDSSSVRHQEFFTVHTANLYDIYHCCVYSAKLLVMDRGTVRNMYSFIPKINFRN